MRTRSGASAAVAPAADNIGLASRARLERRLVVSTGRTFGCDALPEPCKSLAAIEHDRNKQEQEREFGEHRTSKVSKRGHAVASAPV